MVRVQWVGHDRGAGRVAERAVSVGFKADADFDSIIRAHIAGEKAGG